MPISPPFSNYAMCGICDFENGALTLLSEKVSSTEVVRRLRPALSRHPVRIERAGLTPAVVGPATRDRIPDIV